MQRNPTLSGQLLGRAQLAWSRGDYGTAERLLDGAVRADAGSHAAHHNRGGFFKMRGRLTEAETSLRMAYRLAPDDPRTRHALGLVLLSQGRYREGWPLYESRHAIPELHNPKPELPMAEWRGEDPRGKSILIFPDQGLGDQIQFARFAPWLAAKGADVTLLCPAPLASLFAESLGVGVVAAAGKVELPDPDYWVMSGALAARAGLESDQLPNAPYLRARRRRICGARIGVVTSGNPAHVNDANRSLPGTLAERLLSLPGAINLFPQATGARDFAETAELIEDLDLVISVDTSVAHLAGAMGKPTWILVPGVMTDWRWMDGRADSPWYPSARLFRQATGESWEPVVSRIVKALSAEGCAASAEARQIS